MKPQRIGDERQPEGDRGLRRGRPQPIKEVLSSLLAQRGYAQVQSSVVLASTWADAAGAELAPHSRPGTIRRGVLEVSVRNSTVLQELSFKKTALLARLRQGIPGHCIQDLRFRIREIP